MLKRVASAVETAHAMRRDATINHEWLNPSFVCDALASLTTEEIATIYHCKEVEHQVGRFRNMVDCASLANSEGVQGGILEFGTWQGLGLVLLANAFQDSNPQRLFVGVDRFMGLPESSTVWRQGQFADTSLALAKDFIASRAPAGTIFHLVQGDFGDPRVDSEIRHHLPDLAVVHFDADLGSSTRAALCSLDYYLAERQEPIYFLFDDWGIHPDEVPDAFWEWHTQTEVGRRFVLEKLSTTRYTRYLRLSV